MKRDPIFENYTYSQQANSLKMVINWVEHAVRAHVRKGEELGKNSVADYPSKVARQLRLIASRLENL
jgi:hypothetical protein